MAAILTASVLGSLHCAGMCGGFLALAIAPTPAEAAGAEAGGRQRVGGGTLLACYNAGRLVTYCLVGALAGAVGRTLDLSGEMMGVERGAALLAGAVMVVFGGMAVLRLRGVKLPRAPVPGVLKAVAGAGYARAVRLGPVARAGLIGMLTTLLPCGWLYAFVATAAGTADPLRGAAAMAAFWLGTLPVMVALGSGLTAVLGPLRRHVPMGTALLLVAVGLFTLLGRVRVMNTLDSLAEAGVANPVICNGH